MSGSESVQPAVGQVWRERRRQYAKRTVRVTEVGFAFVYTETLTTYLGTPPLRPVKSRVRITLWHSSFVPLADGRAS